jgi:hypothetical protein
VLLYRRRIGLGIESYFRSRIEISFRSRRHGRGIAWAWRKRLRVECDAPTRRQRLRIHRHFGSRVGVHSRRERLRIQSDFYPRGQRLRIQFDFHPRRQRLGIQSLSSARGRRTLGPAKGRENQSQYDSAEFLHDISPLMSEAASPHLKGEYRNSRKRFKSSRRKTILNPPMLGMPDKNKAALLRPLGNKKNPG